MKFLEVTKKSIGCDKPKTVADLYSEICSPGQEFSFLDKEYYTLSIDKDFNVFYCDKNTKTLKIYMIGQEDLFNALEKKKITPIYGNDNLIVDEDLLTEKEVKEFRALRKAMRHIVDNYGPDFQYIVSNTNKTDLKRLAKDCDMDYNLFRRKVTKYLTSGMKDISLISKRSPIFGDKRKRNKPYSYTTLTGRKARDSKGNVIQQGVILTDDIKKSFDPYVQKVRGGLSVSQAFNRFNGALQVREGAFQDGNMLLVDKNLRPTISQFRYYCDLCLGKKDKIIGSKGSLYYHNNHRPLNSDNISNSSFPGDIVEIDAWEADISLVTEDGVHLGRPTVYLMVDRFTRLICAYSIGFEVNSYLGLSNLFMNLIEDNAEIFKRNGLDAKKENIPLPEPFLPNVVVTDNGADFKSDMFRDTLSRLSIDHEIAPPRTGSAKGLVERVFGEFSRSHKDSFKGAGLITKEIDSKHHEEASLVLEVYEKCLLWDIIEHNFKSMSSYPIHDIELLNKEIVPTPFNLWRYYTEEKSFKPREILDKNQYFFDLMVKVKGSLSKKGVVFEGFYYAVQDDPKLVEMQEKEKTIRLDFRLDPRDVSKLYYQDGGKIKFLPLNPQKASNRKFFDKSYAYAKALMAMEKDLKKKGIETNENLMATKTIFVDQIVKNSKINRKNKFIKKSDIKNIRENRKKEKLKRAYDNRIAISLDLDDAPTPPEDNKMIENKTENMIGKYNSYEDFLNDFE